MSYSEKDGQVILTMSREDWGYLLFLLSEAGGKAHRRDRDHVTDFLNRLNQGNPNWNRYYVGEKK